MEARSPSTALKDAPIEALQRHLSEAMGRVMEKSGVRLRADAGMTFPLTDATESVPRRDEKVREIQLRFGMLVGSSSPLPDYFLDLISMEIQSGDESSRALCDFFEIFNERLGQLMLAARRKHDFYLRATDDAGDTISGLLLAMEGLPGSRWLRVAGLDGREMLRYLGLFSIWPRSAAGLEGLLKDYFDGICFRVESHTLTWCRVPGEGSSDRRNALGVLNCTLSEDLILGEWVVDRSNHFRIHIGPLTLSEYRSFLPTGDNRAKLIRLVRSYAPSHLTFDVTLHILGGEIPPLMFEEPISPRLGWATWLLSLVRSDDAVCFGDTDTIPVRETETTAREEA